MPRRPASAIFRSISSISAASPWRCWTTPPRPRTDVNKDDLPAYTSEIAGLGALPAPVWLLHHRPIWAAISGPLGLPIGGNLTLIAAAGKALIPPSVTLMLSGHIHTFEAINYEGTVPPQIVAGNGGDNLDVTPKNLKGSIFQGHSGVVVKDGLSVGGFGFLLLTRGGPEPSARLDHRPLQAGRHAGRPVPFHARRPTARSGGWTVPGWVLENNSAPPGFLAGVRQSPAAIGARC